MNNVNIITVLPALSKTRIVIVDQIIIWTFLDSHKLLYSKIHDDAGGTENSLYTLYSIAVFAFFKSRTVR